MQEGGYSDGKSVGDNTIRLSEMMQVDDDELDLMIESTVEIGQVVDQRGISPSPSMLHTPAPGSSRCITRQYHDAILGSNGKSDRKISGKISKA